MNRKLRWLLSVLPFGLAAVLWIPVSSSTHCGGNSAALSRVQIIALIVREGSFDPVDHSFHFADEEDGLRGQLAFYSRSHWLPEAHFLVSTAPVSEHETPPHRIVAVCDTPYRNVPERWIGSAAPAHAAAFADGSSGLISPAEFAALDRSTFVPLDEIHPPEPQPTGPR